MESINQSPEFEPRGAGSVHVRSVNAMSKVTERLQQLEQEIAILRIRPDTLGRLPSVQQYVGMATELQRLQSDKDSLAELTATSTVEE